MLEYIISKGIWNIQSYEFNKEYEYREIIYCQKEKRFCFLFIVYNIVFCYKNDMKNVKKKYKNFFIYGVFVCEYKRI